MEKQNSWFLLFGFVLGMFFATSCDSEGVSNKDSIPDTEPSDEDSSSANDVDTDPDGGPISDGGMSEEAIKICKRWNDDRANTSEGSWTGNVNSCAAGDLSADGRKRALRLVNLYRFLAGLPPVADDSDKNSKAQECALMMHANKKLSHSPSTSWTCYSKDGDLGAQSSAIAPLPAVAAVDLYMLDPGNATNFGHRRWILANSLGPVGIGSTDSYSCLWTLYGSGTAKSSWTAWPSPGPFPFQALAPTNWGSVDETGWTLQSDAIDLQKAHVTVTAAGVSRPVVVTALDADYGSKYGISLVPDGWTTQVGTTYHVEITGISAPISYDVEFVDCD